MENKNDYYSYAEDDRVCIEILYNNYKEDKKNSSYNCICWMCENVCERYLKQIIEEKITVSGIDMNSEKTNILKNCHSIRKLFRYLTRNGINIENEEEIDKCDGYYYSSRYPGNDSFFVVEKDIEYCYNAMNKCKEVTDKLLER